MAFGVKGLNHLEQDGIIEKTFGQHQLYQYPKEMVILDYKVTINPMLEINQYPLPKPDDIFATLAGGKYFSKIDLPTV